VTGCFSTVRDDDEKVLCSESIVFVVRNAINPLLLRMGHNGIDVKPTSDFEHIK